MLRAQTTLLIISFLFGMALNLFVNIPATLSSAFWFSIGGLLLAIHVLIGLVIGGLAVRLVLTARSLGDWSITGPIIGGLVFSWIAILSGFGFLFFGQNNVLSYTMAIGFLFSFGAYLSIIGKGNLGYT